MCTIAWFKSIEIKHDIYIGKDCMKQFSESLREQAMEIINLKRKEIKFWAKTQQQSCENATIC